MFKVFEDGERLCQALDEQTEPFQTVAERLGYSPFEAHDIALIYRAFSNVAAHEHLALESLAQTVSQVNLPKLALIARVIEKAPQDWQYWFDLAESLPLQDLNRPIQQVLKELA